MNDPEKDIVSKMIYIYCRSNHNTKKELCAECMKLEQYTHKRLEVCKFGVVKPTCQYCPIHCYKPEMRDRIQIVMRFSGPRMIFYHPVTALRHLWKSIKK